SKPPPALSIPERSAFRTAARSRSSKSKSSSCTASSRCSSSSRSSVITHVSFSAARSSRRHPLKGLQHLEFARERLQSPWGLCLPHQRQSNYAAAPGGGAEGAGVGDLERSLSAQPSKARSWLDSQATVRWWCHRRGGARRPSPWQPWRGRRVLAT